MGLWTTGKDANGNFLGVVELCLQGRAGILAGSCGGAMVVTRGWAGQAPSKLRLFGVLAGDKIDFLQSFRLCHVQGISFKVLDLYQTYYVCSFMI